MNNNIIRKYKDVDMQLQTSRKDVRKNCTVYIIFICTIICMDIWLWVSDSDVDNPKLFYVTSIVIPLTLLGIELCYTDWSLKINDNTLLVRRWIFKYKIPLKDLIYIECLPRLYEDLRVRYCECLEIKYKKNNRIKYLDLDYLRKGLFKHEFIKESEIIEFINIFHRDVEPIEGVKESNVLLPEYKDIRTKQEEKEMDDLINKTRRREQKGMWIFFWALICMMVGFFIWIFNIMN